MDFTIIIPHKNSSILLKRLIESFYGKSTYNIQIIVIDDNSNDFEQEELIKLQKKYSFELYKNQGIGAGAARNVGIKHIHGKWTFFADADDFFCDTFPELIKQYYNSDSDIIYFNVTSCYSDSLLRAYRDEHIKTIINNFNKKNEEEYLRCCYSVPWGKMFKSEFIKNNNLKFEEISAGNDMMFSVQSGVKAKQISCNVNEIYCNTVSIGSITTTINKEKFESRFQATLRVNNFLRKNKYHKYQISILFFIAKSLQFGFKYFIHVLKCCIKNKSNFIIGFKKILSYNKVIRDRQNPHLTQTVN